VPGKAGKERSREELQALVVELETLMREAAIAMDFESAARLRDQLFEVRTSLGDNARSARGVEVVKKRPPGMAPLRGSGGTGGGRGKSR
jgi:excinuclease ABC subunit B